MMKFLVFTVVLGLLVAGCRLRRFRQQSPAIVDGLQLEL
jgi:hypothetical protein